MINYVLCISKDRLSALGNELPKLRTIARAAVKKTPDSLLLVDIKSYKIGQHIFLFQCITPTYTILLLIIDFNDPQVATDKLGNKV